MDCGSAFQESLNSQDKEVQRVLNLFASNGTAVLLKKEFAEDKVKKNLSKAILFLQDFIKNNKSKEDEAQTSNKKVAANPDKSSKGVVKRESERIKKREEIKTKPKKQEVPKKNICFAFKFDKCPNKEEDCKNSHPKKCQKFSNYGHFAIDEQGCETQKCDLYHPKLCRNSIKAKECPFRKCRFQHLEGTKIIPMKEYFNASSVKGRNMFEEDGKINILVSKFDKCIELLMKLVKEEEDHDRILDLVFNK